MNFLNKLQKSCLSNIPQTLHPESPSGIFIISKEDARGNPYGQMILCKNFIIVFFEYLSGFKMKKQTEQNQNNRRMARKRTVSFSLKQQMDPHRESICVYYKYSCCTKIKQPAVSHPFQLLSI